MRRSTVSRRELLRVLRRECPPLLPVRVRFRPLPDYWGVTNLVRDARGRPSHFTVSVHSRAPEEVVLDTLMHEWSHAVAWQEGREVSDHGPEWGVAFARIYRASVGERLDTAQ